MVISTKNALCCTVLFALRFGQMSLSSLAAEGHAVTDSLRSLQGVGNPASTNAIAMSDPKEITEEERLFQLSPAAREAEIKLLENTSIQIDERIRLVLPNRGYSNSDFRKVQSQLQELRLTLKRPILDRVFQLSGLGPSMTDLYMKPTIGPGDQAESSTRRKVLGKDLVQSESKLKKSSSWKKKLWSHLKRPSTSNTVRKDTNTVQEDDQLGYEIPDDILGVIKHFMINGRMEAWKVLENRLIGFEAEDKCLRVNAPNFKLRFLVVFYTLGDLICRHQLLPSYFIKEIEIFNTPTLLKMIQYHVDLLFAQGKKRFFDRSDSVIPQLDFLSNSPNFKHFHRSIKSYVEIRQVELPSLHRNFFFSTLSIILPQALPVEDHRSVVYLVLTTIMKQAPWFESAGDGGGTLGVLHFIKSAKHSPRANLPIIKMMGAVVRFLHHPAKRCTNKTRVEFQVVYYVADFLNKYYRPLFEAVMIRENWNLTLFRDQMNYLGAYLQLFRNRSDDTNHLAQSQLESFLNLPEPNNIFRSTPLIKWMKDVATSTFDHKLTLDYHLLDKSPPFTLWMGQSCCYCSFPYRKCPPSCQAAKQSWL
ncbi:hypothetical protein H4Q26_004691 [Puccinia striiformis f. sp. tritici PST-130]|nr:hypothetical protein H4Q26_004691 [Puccinia striiformis f. sp. tritici PST-130]